MGPRAGLDRCGKSRPNRDSIPGPSSPQPVAIPTKLPGPPYNHVWNLFSSNQAIVTVSGVEYIEVCLGYVSLLH